jgi:hypothetical protein
LISFLSRCNSFLENKPIEEKLEHRFQDFDEEETEAMMESLWEPEFKYLYWKAAEENKRVVEFPSVHMIANIPLSDSNEDVWFTEDDYETRKTVQATIQQEPNKILELGPPSQVHFLHIDPVLPYDQSIGEEGFLQGFCTADLEAIILPNGSNFVYMAAWHNNTSTKVYFIEPNSLNQLSFLERFWRELIEKNRGRVCYFHNWGGYDSIISLPSLLNCLPDLSFKPIMKDGELMSLQVFQGTTNLITIKDSIRILPASLSKLAKDWKVPTQKDHFPH